VESLAAQLEKLHIGESHEIGQFKAIPIPNPRCKAQVGGRLTRPPTAHNIFKGLETVPEDDSQNCSTSAAVGVSNYGHHYIKFPGKSNMGRQSLFFQKAKFASCH
jgi:hypothetical protein